MRAGLRRHKITIQRKKATQNTYGEESVTWVDDSECWAAIFPVRGNEYFSNQQVQGAVTHKIHIKYQTLQDGTRINPNCRIVFDDRYFYIQSVIDPDERRINLDLMATEEV